MSLFIYIVVGAIIGYVTNYIAIWMLFHPYEEKRILGMRLPFTPGLIPARQKEIAEKVAKNIRVVFLSGDNLKSLLKRLELPYRLYHISQKIELSSLLPHLSKDKKVWKGKLTIVLLESIGKAIFYQDPPLEVIKEALMELK